MVDNGSADGTPELLLRDYPGALRLLREPRPGVWHTRNRGISEAAGDTVAFIDDDARAEPGWLRRIESVLLETGAMGAGGPTVPDWESPPPAYILRSQKALSYLGVFSLGLERRRLSGFRDFLIGTNCAFRRRVFDEGHRFRPVPWGRPVGAEDLEFSRRIASMYPVVFDPKIVVRHRIPSRKLGLASLAATAFDYGLKKAAIRRPFSPRGWEDLWGVDGWISLFSGAGLALGTARRALCGEAVSGALG